MRQAPPLNPPSPNNGVHPDLADTLEKYREEAANLNGAATTPEARANLRTATMALDQIEHATDARGKMNILKRHRQALGDDAYKELRDTIIHTANPPDLDLVMGKFNEDARELEQQIDKNDPSQVENLKHVKDFSRAMRLTGDPVVQSQLLQDARSSIGEEAYGEFRAALNQKLLETANNTRTPEDAVAEKHGENLNRMVRRILHPTYAGNEIREDFQNLPIPESIDRTSKDLLLRREKVLELMDAERRATAKGKTDSIAALQAQRLGELRTAAEAGYQQAYKSFNKELVDELFKQESDLAGGAWDENAKKEAYKRIVVRTSLPCIQHLDQEFEQLKRERLTVESEQEKGRVRRMCEWYAKLPQYQRIALGAVIGTAIAVPTTAFLLPSAGAALGGWFAVKGAAVAASQSALIAQGGGTYLTYRVGRAAAGGTVVGGLRAWFDHNITKRFGTERAAQERTFNIHAQEAASGVLERAGAFFGNAAEALEKRGLIIEAMMREARENAQKIAELDQQERKKKSHLGRGLLLGLIGGGVTGALTDMVVLPRIASAAVAPPLPPGPGTARASLAPPPGPGGSGPRVPSGSGTFPGSAHAGIPPVPTAGPDTSGLPGPGGRAPSVAPLTPPIRTSAPYADTSLPGEFESRPAGMPLNSNAPEFPGGPDVVPPPAPKGFFQSIREALFGAVDETGKGIDKAAGTVADQLNKATGAAAQGAKDTAAAAREVGTNIYDTVTGGDARASTAPSGGSRGGGYQPAMDQARGPVVSSDAARASEAADVVRRALAAAESPSGAPAVPVESTIGRSMSGIETVQKGDSVWKMLGHQLHERYGSDFDNLPEAQKRYVIDALKDQVVAKPKSFGLVNPDRIRIGQKIDFSQLFKPESQSDIHAIFGKARGLTQAQMDNIMRSGPPVARPARPAVAQQPTPAQPTPGRGLWPDESRRLQPTPPDPGLKPPIEAATQPVDYTAANTKRFGFVGHFGSQIKAVENVDVATYLREVKQLVAEQAADRPLTSSILPDAYAPGYLDKHVRLADAIEAAARKGSGGRIPPDFGKGLPVKEVLKEIKL